MKRECPHNHYTYKNGYLVSKQALKAMKLNKIAWMGKVIENCSKCGKDIRYASVVRVKTAEQYLKDLNK